MATTTGYYQVLMALVLTSSWPVILSQCTGNGFTSPSIHQSFYPFGTGVGDSTLTGDTEVSEPIVLTSPFIYFRKRFYKLFVNANGLVSFNTAVTGENATSGIPNDEAVAAIYWSDVGLDKNNGTVYYRTIANSTTCVRLSEELNADFGTPLGFTAEQAVVVTWVNVAHQTGDCNSPVSTFQLVLATNGRYSFVIYNYAGLGWTEGFTTGTYPLIGLNYKKDAWCELPVSGFPNVTSLLTSSNVGINGVWRFRVDSPRFVNNLCNQYQDLVTLSPEMASPLGGTQVLVSGVTVTSSTALKAKVGGVDATVIYVSDQRVRVVVPALWWIGPALLQLSMDDGATFQVEATLTLGVREGVVPMVTREEANTWDDPTGEDVNITWDKNVINATKVDVFFATFENDANGKLVEILVPLLTDVANDGEAAISVEGLPLVSDNDLKLYTLGAILVKASSGASVTGEVLLYSDIHMAMWFVRNFLMELVLRNRLRELNPSDTTPILQSALWDKLRMKFMTASGTAVQIKETIKGQVFSQCVMWKALLAIVVEDRCENPQSQVSLSVPVPCTLRQAQADPAWMEYPVKRVSIVCEQRTESKCFLPVTPTSTGETQMACYNAQGALVENAPAARPLLAHPDGLVLSDNTVVKRWIVDHLRLDAVPKMFCCMWAGTAECNRYREARPATPCENYTPPGRGGAGGSTHYATFDGLKFTFNGVGEFVATRSTSKFEVQMRTKALSNMKASEITAIACKANNSATVEVRTTELVGLELLVDGTRVRLTGLESLVYTGVKCQIIFDLTLVKSVKIIFDSGEVVTVTQSDGSLQFIIMNPASNEGEMKGLLGNFDYDETNDLKPPTGAAIAIDSTPELINTYGLTWRTAAADSLFTYATNEAHADLQDTTFTAVFPALNLSTPDACQQAVFCVYDYSVTDDLDFALATKSFFDKLQKVQYDLNSGRQCPALSVDHGSLATVDRRFGETVDLSCDNGYVRGGSASRTCQIDLTWSGSKTTCVKQVTSCDEFICKNNGTCEAIGNKPSCKCKSNFSGDNCEDVVADVRTIVVVGAVISSILLIAIIVVSVFIWRTRPNRYVDDPITKLLEYDSRHGLPVFKGTMARRYSNLYDSYGANKGYRYPYGEKRHQSAHSTERPVARYPRPGYPSPYNSRRRSDHHDPYTLSRYSNSDKEDSIDKIYQGNYEAYPDPDYERTEYTSHIEKSQLDYPNISFSRSSNPKNPKSSNWMLNL